MGTTPKYGFRYPDLDEGPNGPAQIQALAIDVETVVAGVETTIEALAANLPVSKTVASATTNASGYVTVTISPPLPYTPNGWSVNASNSQLKASVDESNSSASSLRIYFRTITTASSPILASGSTGSFSWQAYP